MTEKVTFPFANKGDTVVLTEELMKKVRQSTHQDPFCHNRACLRKFKPGETVLAVQVALFDRQNLKQENLDIDYFCNEECRNQEETCIIAN